MGYIGKLNLKNDWVEPLVNSLQSQMEQQKQQKLAMAQAMIQSGQYQPQLGGQQPGFMDNFKAGMLGPQVGGANMNVGGQNFQYQTPAIQAQNIQSQMDAYRKAGLIAPATGAPTTPGVPTLGSSAGVSAPFQPNLSFDNGKLAMGLSQVDPIKALTAQKDQLEIDKLKNEVAQSASDQALYSQSPEDIRSSLKKTNPAIVTIGDKMINGGLAFKDMPGYGQNAKMKNDVLKYVASQGIDEQDLKMRNKVISDYSPGGPVGKQLTTAGTIVQHLSELQKTLDELNNTGNKPYNQIGQTVDRTFGTGKLGTIKKLDSIKNAISGEYDKYLRAGGSAESGIERIIQTMDDADPHDVQKQVADEGANLMAGRLGQYVSGWYSAFNRPNDRKIPNTVLSTQTRFALKKMGLNDIVKGVEGSKGMSGADEADNPNIGSDSSSKSESISNNDPLGLR